MSRMSDMVFLKILHRKESEKTGHYFRRIYEREENRTGVSPRVCTHFFSECGECNLNIFTFFFLARKSFLRSQFLLRIKHEYNDKYTCHIECDL